MTELVKQNAVIETFVVTKHFRVKPDGDADTSKNMKLELTVDGATARDLALGTIKDDVIKIQRLVRANWDKYPDGHVHKKTFNKPASSVDPTEQLLMDARATGVDITDKNALADYIISRISNQ